MSREIDWVRQKKKREGEGKEGERERESKWFCDEREVT
jgi:hypothetical protein